MVVGRKAKEPKKLRSSSDRRGYLEGTTFHLTHDAGFFSMCSVTLFELCRRQEQTTTIRAEEAFVHFRGQAGENPWDYYFLQPQVTVSAPYSKKNPFGRRLRHHSDYRTLPVWRVRRHLKRYFTPSEEVLQRRMELVSRHSIDPRKTIAVCYRGTDKATEIELAPPREYLEAVQQILRKKPGYRVLVQTDQAQVRDYLMNELGDLAFYLPEMPVTESDSVIHAVIPRDQQVDFGQTLLATVLIMAETKYLVTHTGNMALWTVLFRGNTKRTIQLGMEV